MKFELEIKKFEVSDIVTTSGGGCGENCGLECGGELE